MKNLFTVSVFFLFVGLIRGMKKNKIINDDANLRHKMTTKAKMFKTGRFECELRKKILRMDGWTEYGYNEANKTPKKKFCDLFKWCCNNKNNPGKNEKIIFKK